MTYLMVIEGLGVVLMFLLVGYQAWWNHRDTKRSIQYFRESMIGLDYQSRQWAKEQSDKLAEHMKYMDAHIAMILERVDRDRGR